MLAHEVPRVLTTRDLPRLGITRSAMRTELTRGRWRRLAPGVLLTRPDEPTRTDWILAGSALTGGTGVVSGWDAVRLRGIGDPSPPCPTVLVLTAAGHNRVVGGVHLRPSRRRVAWSLVHVCDEPVRFARPARAVCDTGLDYRGLMPVRDLVTAAVQRELCEVDELVDELADCPQNWSAWLRVAVGDVALGAKSIAEAELRDLCRAGALPEYEANVPILDEHGVLVAEADALWRGLRAALEVDSKQHHFLEPKWTRTMERHNTLTASGLAVTHYPPQALRQRSGAVVREIERWLRGRAIELNVSYPPAPAVRTRPPAPFRIRIRS